MLVFRTHDSCPKTKVQSTVQKLLINSAFQSSVCVSCSFIMLKQFITFTLLNMKSCNAQKKTDSLFSVQNDIQKLFILRGFLSVSHTLTDPAKNT